MDLIPEEFKAWLLQSIPGVILLGAIGSIIATMLIYIGQSALKSLINSKERIVMRLIYGYVKSIEVGETFRDVHVPHSPETRYLASVVYETGMFLSVAAILFLSISTTIMVYLIFALERPLVLSSLVGLVLFFANKALKHGLYITSLLSQESIDTKEAIEKAQPKTFAEWEKAVISAERSKP